MVASGWHSIGGWERMRARYLAGLTEAVISNPASSAG